MISQEEQLKRLKKLYNSLRKSKYSSRKFSSQTLRNLVLKANPRIKESWIQMFLEAKQQYWGTQGDFNAGDFISLVLSHEYHPHFFEKIPEILKWENNRFFRGFEHFRLGALLKDEFGSKKKLNNNTEISNTRNEVSFSFSTEPNHQKVCEVRFQILKEVTNSIEQETEKSKYLQSSIKLGLKKNLLKSQVAQLEQIFTDFNRPQMNLSVQADSNSNYWLLVKDSRVNINERSRLFGLDFLSNIDLGLDFHFSGNQKLEHIVSGESLLEENFNYTLGKNFRNLDKSLNPILGFVFADFMKIFNRKMNFKMIQKIFGFDEETEQRFQENANLRSPNWKESFFQDFFENKETSLSLFAFIFWQLSCQMVGSGSLDHLRRILEKGHQMNIFGDEIEFEIKILDIVVRYRLKASDSISPSIMSLCTQFPMFLFLKENSEKREAKKIKTELKSKKQVSGFLSTLGKMDLDKFGSIFAQKDSENPKLNSDHAIQELLSIKRQIGKLLKALKNCEAQNNQEIDKFGQVVSAQSLSMRREIQNRLESLFARLVVIFGGSNLKNLTMSREIKSVESLGSLGSSGEQGEMENVVSIATNGNSEPKLRESGDIIRNDEVEESLKERVERKRKLDASDPNMNHHTGSQGLSNPDLGNESQNEIFQNSSSDDLLFDSQNKKPVGLPDQNSQKVNSDNMALHLLTKDNLKLELLEIAEEGDEWEFSEMTLKTSPNQQTESQTEEIIKIEEFEDFEGSELESSKRPDKMLENSGPNLEGNELEIIAKSLSQIIQDHLTSNDTPAEKSQENENMTSRSKSDQMKNDFEQESLDGLSEEIKNPFKMLDQRNSQKERVFDNFPKIGNLPPYFTENNHEILELSDPIDDFDSLNNEGLNICLKKFSFRKGSTKDDKRKFRTSPNLRSSNLKELKQLNGNLQNETNLLKFQEERNFSEQMEVKRNIGKESIQNIQNPDPSQREQHSRESKTKNLDEIELEKSEARIIQRKSSDEIKPENDISLNLESIDQSLVSKETPNENTNEQLKKKRFKVREIKPLKSDARYYLHSLTKRHKIFAQIIRPKSQIQKTVIMAKLIDYLITQNKAERSKEQSIKSYSEIQMDKMKRSVDMNASFTTIHSQKDGSRRNIARVRKFEDDNMERIEAISVNAHSIHIERGKPDHPQNQTKSAFRAGGQNSSAHGGERNNNFSLKQKNLVGDKGTQRTEKSGLLRNNPTLAVLDQEDHAFSNFHKELKDWGFPEQDLKTISIPTQRVTSLRNNPTFKNEKQAPNQQIAAKRISENINNQEMRDYILSRPANQIFNPINRFAKNSQIKRNLKKDLIKSIPILRVPSEMGKNLVAANLKTGEISKEKSNVQNFPEKTKTVTKVRKSVGLKTNQIVDQSQRNLKYKECDSKVLKVSRTIVHKSGVTYSVSEKKIQNPVRYLDLKNLESSTLNVKRTIRRIENPIEIKKKFPHASKSQSNTHSQNNIQTRKITSQTKQKEPNSHRVVRSERKLEPQIMSYKQSSVKSPRNVIVSPSNLPNHVETIRRGKATPIQSVRSQQAISTHFQNQRYAFKSKKINVVNQTKYEKSALERKQLNRVITQARQPNSQQSYNKNVNFRPQISNTMQIQKSQAKNPVINNNDRGRNHMALISQNLMKNKIQSQNRKSYLVKKSISPGTQSKFTPKRPIQDIKQSQKIRKFVPSPRSNNSTGSFKQLPQSSQSDPSTKPNYNINYINSSHREVKISQKKDVFRATIEQFNDHYPEQQQIVQNNFSVGNSQNVSNHRSQTSNLKNTIIINPIVSKRSIEIERSSQKRISPQRHNFGNQKYQISNVNSRKREANYGNTTHTRIQNVTKVLKNSRSPSFVDRKLFYNPKTAHKPQIREINSPVKRVITNTRVYPKSGNAFVQNESISIDQISKNLKIPRN